MSIVHIPMTAQGALSEIRYREGLLQRFQGQDNGPQDLDPTAGRVQLNEHDTITFSGSAEQGEVRESYALRRRQDLTAFSGRTVQVELFERHDYGFWRQRMTLDRDRPELSTCTVEQTHGSGP